MHMLDQSSLARIMFPVGGIDKTEVRQIAADRSLRTAFKPDSQDVCFITSTGGREAFLGDRIPVRPAQVIDTSGSVVGEVPAVELVTIGQRRGIGLPGGGPKRYVVDVDHASSTVVVGSDAEMRSDSARATSPTWVDQPVSGEVLVQMSAHGATVPAVIEPDDTGVAIDWHEPQRRVAPGQSIVFYDLADRCVLGGATAVRSAVAHG